MCNSILKCLACHGYLDAYIANAQFLEFNTTRICERAPLGSTACPFASVTNSDVHRYYSAGPPYVIHIQDVLALSKRWSELVPPTYDEYPLLYAEMFAYSMAAADLDLKHNLMDGLFTGCMTHWPHGSGKGVSKAVEKSAESKALEKSARAYADAIEKALEKENGNEGASSCFLRPLQPPPFLHYCSRYSFATPYLPREDGKSTTPQYHFFAKRRVDHDILDCTPQDRNWLAPFVSHTPEKMEGGQKDWNALAVCAVVRSINFAKNKGCGGGTPPKN